MSVKGNLLVLVVFFIIFGQITSQSQTFRTELNALSKGADVILTGKVVKQKSEWTRNKSRIITKTTVQVDEYIKGNLSSGSVVISHPGGEIDGVGELYSHMPEFRDNEEVLVFLNKDKNSPDYKVFSGEDGKLSIVKDKTGKKVTASNIPLSAIKTKIKSYTNQR
jgi:hypothetical protein